MSTLTRFTESFKDWNIDITTIKPIPIKLTEANSKTKIEGKEIDILGGYKIPIWRLGEKNKNGRIYEEKLADKVIKENKVTAVLDGHPDDEYSPKLEDIIAVAKNPTKESVGKSKIMFVEVYFTKKDLFENVKRSLDLGLQLEQSSSGLGELREDGVNVNTESYFLERYCDLLVSDSSYSVSFDKTNEITESIIKKDENLLTINSIEEKTNEKDKIMDKSVKTPVALLRKNLEGYIEKADSTIDINSRLNAFTEIREWVRESDSELLNDLLEKCDVEIKSILEKKEELSVKGQKTDMLEETISAKDQILESYKTQLSSTVEKLEKCYQVLDNLKSYSNKYKEMFDIASGKINTMVEAEDYLKAKKEAKDKEEEKEEKEKELEKVKESYDILKGKYNSFIEAVKKEKIQEATRIATIKKKRQDEKIKREILEQKELESIQKKQLEEQMFEEEQLNYTQQIVEVKQYYKELCEKHGTRVMESFKEKIYSARTLPEAQIKYFKLLPSIDEAEDIISKKSNSLVENLNVNKKSTFSIPEPKSYRL